MRLKFRGSSDAQGERPVLEIPAAQLKLSPQEAELLAASGQSNVKLYPNADGTYVCRLKFRTKLTRQNAANLQLENQINQKVNQTNVKSQLEQNQQPSAGADKQSSRQNLKSPSKQSQKSTKAESLWQSISVDKIYNNVYKPAPHRKNPHKKQPSHSTLLQQQQQQLNQMQFRLGNSRAQREFTQRFNPTANNNNSTDYNDRSRYAIGGSMVAQENYEKLEQDDHYLRLNQTMWQSAAGDHQSSFFSEQNKPVPLLVFGRDVDQSRGADGSARGNEGSLNRSVNSRPKGELSSSRNSSGNSRASFSPRGRGNGQPGMDSYEVEELWNQPTVVLKPWY